MDDPKDVKENGPADDVDKAELANELMQQSNAMINDAISQCHIEGVPPVRPAFQQAITDGKFDDSAPLQGTDFFKSAQMLYESQKSIFTGENSMPDVNSEDKGISEENEQLTNISNMFNSE